MTEHIDNNGWIRIFSKDPAAEPDFALLAHIARCEECRKLYEAGKQLKASLNAGNAADITYRTNTAAYRAVASDRGPQAAQAASGFLVIDIDRNGSDIFFDESSMAAEGFANKYALYTDDDGHRLVDSGDLLSASITGNKVTITLVDGEPCATVELVVPGPETECIALPGQAEFTLPDVPICTLKIQFGQ